MGFLRTRSVDITPRRGGRARSRPLFNRLELWVLPSVVVTFRDIQRRIGSIDCQPRRGDGWWFCRGSQERQRRRGRESRAAAAVWRRRRPRQPRRPAGCRRTAMGAAQDRGRNPAGHVSLDNLLEVERLPRAMPRTPRRRTRPTPWPTGPPTRACSISLKPILTRFPTTCSGACQTEPIAVLEMARTQQLEWSHLQRSSTGGRRIRPVENRSISGQ
jgi:hypothetical protein